MKNIKNQIILKSLVMAVLCCCQCVVTRHEANSLITNDVSNANFVVETSAKVGECEQFAGRWQADVFQDIDALDKMICGKDICETGINEGNIDLECSLGKLSGSILTSFSSYPPPGHEIRYPLLVKLSNKNLSIDFEDYRGCQIKYKLHQFGAFLVGDFTQKKCRYKLDFETNEEFVKGTKGGVVLSNHHILRTTK
jgi:hypothetical protein